MLRALERFDVTRGVAFWSYASFWARQAMQHLVAELTRPFVFSDRPCATSAAQAVTSRRASAQRAETYAR